MQGNSSRKGVRGEGEVVELILVFCANRGVPLLSVCDAIRHAFVTSVFVPFLGCERHFRVFDHYHIRGKENEILSVVHAIENFFLLKLNFFNAVCDFIESY